MNITELQPKTFDGHNINDTTNYIAKKLPDGTPLLAQGAAAYSQRVDQFPTDDGVKLQGREYPLQIIIKSGTLAELTKWFDTSPKFEASGYASPKILVATDLSSVDWYVYARPLSFQIYGSGGTGYTAKINLFLADPIWRNVTPNTSTWNISATGQTKNVSVNGNKYSRPTFTITPTSIRGGGFNFKRYIPIANQTTRIYKDAVDLIDGNWNTAALINDTTVSNQVNAGGGTGTGTTPFAIDTAVGGGLPGSGIAYCGTEQFSFTISGSTLTPVVRGLNGTSAANHADNAVISISRMAADGSDVRVYNDETGLEEYRWFGGGGINSSTTKVFVNLTMPPKIQGTVSGAISNSGAVATITLQTNATNLAMLKLLAKVSYKFVSIDMGTGTVEHFKFTTVTPATYKITGCTRAQKNTSNQSHASAATIRHIHGYYIEYGNSALSAPTTDDTLKPMLDLTNSTNTSHVYTDFKDAPNPNRSCQWKSQSTNVIGTDSEFYTATQDTFADVASVAGQILKNWKVGTAYRAGSGNYAWSLYHPAGITTLTWTGEKAKNATTWPDGAGNGTAGMQKSNDGKTWTTIANEASPSSSTGTYEALSSHSAVSLSGTYLYIRHYLSGTTAAKVSWTALGITAVTATLDSANTPLILFSAVESDNYEDFVLTNTTTGHTIAAATRVPVNTALTINTDTLEAYTDDGAPVKITLDDESRAEWMPLSPGVTNTLQFDETGLVAVTVVTTWPNRNL